jgi:hypothetical protein
MEGGWWEGDGVVWFDDIFRCSLGHCLTKLAVSLTVTIFWFLAPLLQGYILVSDRDISTRVGMIMIAVLIVSLPIKRLSYLKGDHVGSSSRLLLAMNRGNSSPHQYSSCREMQGVNVAVAKSGCSMILLTMWWLPLLIQILFGTEGGTPDLMDNMISVLECDVHDSGAIVAKRYLKQGHTLHISDLNRKTR